MAAPLSQGYGYGIVVGLGLAFSAVMIFLTWALKRCQREVVTSEEFNTAGRSVKKGLIATAVVSSWTWAATLLQSSVQAYKNGVSGPFWYASGATVQIILFATLAIELKRKAPGAHTYLEIIRVRYGAITHWVYMFFAVCTNILVTAMLLTGGSAVLSDLTGMHTVAACFLLPLGVMIYTIFGGLKSTILSDYVHTIILMVMIMIFVFTAYATSDVLGSPGAVWDKLVERAIETPVEGNAGGSYLTMKSHHGGIFFVINIIGNFGTVFLDNGYWNKAIAASPAAALPGYVIGGLSWFAIPWLTATTMGLACLALEDNPVFPTYPLRMSSADVSAGLVLPNAAVALLGKSGAICTLLLLFMAITSASSSELISASSIFTYDIYKTYMNPKASGKSLIFVSHACVFAFAIALAGFSTALYYIGIGMGYLYLLMGVIISSAVLPASLTLLWSGQNWWAATISPVAGFACALIGWLVTTKGLFSELTVDSTGSDMPMLAGNVIALLSPAIFIGVCTLIFKVDHFDFKELKKIKPVHDAAEDAVDYPGVEVDAEDEYVYQDPEEKALLDRYAKIARVICVVMALCFLILWPMPMYGTGYIFSRKFFTGWVVVGIIWIFFSTFCVCILPLWEGRYGIFYAVRGMYWDVTAQSHKLREWQDSNPEKMHNPHGAMNVTFGKSEDGVEAVSSSIEVKK